MKARRALVTDYHFSTGAVENTFNAQYFFFFKKKSEKEKESCTYTWNR